MRQFDSTSSTVIIKNAVNKTFTSNKSSISRLKVTLLEKHTCRLKEEQIISAMCYAKRYQTQIFFTQQKDEEKVMSVLQLEIYKSIKSKVVINYLVAALNTELN